MPANQRVPEALLFDLGGVVFDVTFERAIRVWAGHAGEEPTVLAKRFALDEAYERHERGEIEASAYFEALAIRLGIDIEPEQLEEGWNAIFGEPIAGIEPSLTALRGRIPMYAFSNSNSTHQAVWSRRFAALLDQFDRVFVSCEIGLRKPEAAAFRHVSAATGHPLDSMLFFDDTHENVEGARRAGLPAVHVRSFRDVRGALDHWLG